MSISTSLLTSATDCESLTKILEKEKDNLEFRKIQLQRQRKSFQDNAVEINAELQAVSAEIASLETILAGLPEGDLKKDNLKKKKKADLKKYLLEEKKGDYGSIALIEREVELAITDAQLTEVNTAITEVANRKAAL